jgi:hypothetical protein
MDNFSLERIWNAVLPAWHHCSSLLPCAIFLPVFRGWEGAGVGPSKASDMALLMLALSNSAVVMKLGSAAVACPLFSSSLMEEIKRLMQKLPEFMSMDQLYTFSSSVGLKQEFLEIFGLRAANDQNWQESGREGVFWVNLVHQLLWAALSREGFVSKLKAFDSIEVSQLFYEESFCGRVFLQTFLLDQQPFSC